VEKVAPKTWAAFAIFKQTAQNKQTPTGRKFAKFGHYVQKCRNCEPVIQNFTPEIVSTTENPFILMNFEVDYGDIFVLKTVFYQTLFLLSMRTYIRKQVAKGKSIQCQRLSQNKTVYIGTYRELNLLQWKSLPVTCRYNVRHTSYRPSS
jgi:hypothetical protein